MRSFYELKPRSLLLRHLVRCSRELISRDQGSTSVRPYTASTVLLHWWVAQTWRSLFPFCTLNTFIILSVLNISMSYSLLNVCLFPFLNKSHAETKVIKFGVFHLVFNSKDRNRLRSLISSRHRNKLQTKFLGSAAHVGPVLKRDARYDLLGCRVKLYWDRTWSG